MKKWIALLIMLAPLVVSAHARIKTSPGVQPRSMNAGIKQGPCGVVKALTYPTLYSGDKIIVNWEETVDHPGRFEFRFSTDNDSTFTLVGVVEDTATGPTPHQYSVELTLPSVACEKCTLQMIQVMTENPRNPSNYYSCADFRLIPSGAPMPTPAPTPADPPAPAASATPTAADDCH